jgi:hypothetical protein
MHEIYVFSSACRAALEFTQPLMLWVPGADFMGLRRQGHETDHSLFCNAEVKNKWKMEL